MFATAGTSGEGPWRITAEKLHWAKTAGTPYDLTTPQYWDCECRNLYIHGRTEFACRRCGAERDEQPDSHVSEVTAAGFPLDESAESLAAMDEMNRQWLPLGLR